MSSSAFFAAELLASSASHRSAWQKIEQSQGHAPIIVPRWLL